ncbi:sigma-70 family RNA polymerase sigma factor [Rubritalea tangerina]|uniref:Sigma-70 family RNA polymerase sigma factor n=2 Tax=Rubritalea tangerina TaxID=430798 RepID=A0ABW4Z9F9_9BACT
MPSSPQQTQQFVALLTDHQEVIRCYILSLLPGSSDVRDLQQEVNMFLWEKMEEFQLGSNFGAWACTVAYYKVLDYRRKLKKDGILVFNDTLCELLGDDSQTDAQPEAISQKRSALNQCLLSLTQNERKLLITRYASDHNPMDAIAAATGRSKASLRVTLSRLRSKLRSCITKRLIQQGGTA